MTHDLTSTPGRKRAASRPLGRRQVAHGALLLLVLGLGGFLRLHNLGQTPGFYSDEGTLLNISHNLLQGRWQYLALTQSTLIAARLPLFPALLAIVSRVFGEGIQTLRVLTGMLGVISIALVYLLARALDLPRARECALVAALMLAIHPHAVTYSRLGFSYNLLAPITLITCIATWQFIVEGGHRYLILAGILVGLGTTSDIAMLTFLPAFVLVASTRGWRPAVKLLGASLVVPLLYVGYMMISTPEAFVFDLRFTLTRFSALPVVLQLPMAVVNIAGILRFDPWWLLASIGLFTMKPLRARWLLLLTLTIPLLLMARTVIGLPIRAYHYLIPLLPLAAIGTSSLLMTGVPVIAQTFEAGVKRLVHTWGVSEAKLGGVWAGERIRRFIGAMAVFFFVVSPFLISTLLTVNDIRTELRSPVDDLLVDPDQARGAAEFVNSHAAADDLIIASPAIAWLLKAQVADFQQALAFEGLQTEHLPARIPANRFAYSVAADRARYVVIDPIWRNWAGLVMPDVANLMSAVEAWPVEFADGDVMVHSNPAFSTR